MASAVDAHRLPVSVYLLKKSRTNDAWHRLQAVADSVQPLVDWVPDGRFLTLPAEPEAPKWLGHLSTLLAQAAPPLVGQSPSALLWVPRGDKTFVFTFGYGHSKIKDEWVEPEFGKVLALSVVPQGAVKEVRAEQVFARRHIASERAPTASTVREFGYEPDRDMFAAIEGVPEEKYRPTLGAKVRGGTSFKFDLEVSNLLQALDQIIERFDSGDHQRRWPQANNLILVRDSDRIELLDAKLGKILEGPNPDRAISLAAPTERSGDKPYPQHFVIGRMTDPPATSPYLTFAGWLGHLRTKALDLNLEAANTTRVHLLDADKAEIDSCSMYECFGVEVPLTGVTNVLSSGHWYAANTKFVNTTNKILQSLGPPPHPLTTWDTICAEGDYNAGACRVDRTLWLFDKALINFGGGKSSFEFCDIMHLRTRTLYFVKNPAGSAGVSHLCEQVRRTAEMFFSADESYRKKLAARITKLNNNWTTSWLDDRPKRHEWNLCLVLMGKNLSALPFFAKCGVARLLRELRGSGYDVSFQAV